MLKELVNECRITFRLSTIGPLLIKGRDKPTAGIISAARNDCRLKSSQDDPNMIFIRTWRNGSYEPVIPGSSLKGVMRSHCERISRTLLPLSDSDDSKLGCCNPFIIEENNNLAEMFCGSKIKLRKENGEELTSRTIFRESCPICKLFGNTYLRSRIFIPDGNINIETKHMLVRDGVGIDRYSGGASDGAKFDFEVAENAVFTFKEIVIQNFDLWQLGLLAYLFQDFKDQLIKIGYGKSRGLGSVEGQIDKLEIIYFGTHRPEENKVVGMAHFFKNTEYYTEQERNAMVTEIELPDDITTSLLPNGYRYKYVFPNHESAMKLLGYTAPCFSSANDSGYLNGTIYTVPETMQKTFIEEIRNRLRQSHQEEAEE